jgi:hypothetical protein
VSDDVPIPNFPYVPSATAQQMAAIDNDNDEDDILPTGTH